MRKIYFCLLLFQMIAVSASAELYKGYIITLNGYHLTGQIGEIYMNEDRKHVVFVNDFGTPYMISPRLIAGFAYDNGERLVTFNSIILDKKWAFMELLSEGEGLKLLKSPEKEIEYVIDAYGLSTAQVKGNKYFIQLRKRKPVQVKRLGFRKQMKQLLGRRAPYLAKKIGTKGYRYNNIEDIAREYLEEFETTRYIM
ncbi:MAG: hypothetical protein AAF705_19560 [Bacteroidota bacterium]